MEPIVSTFASRITTIARQCSHTANTVTEERKVTGAPHWGQSRTRPGTNLCVGYRGTRVKSRLLPQGRGHESRSGALASLAQGA